MIVHSVVVLIILVMFTLSITDIFSISFPPIGVEEARQDVVSW